MTFWCLGRGDPLPTKRNTGRIFVVATPTDPDEAYVRYKVIRSSGGWNKGDHVYVQKGHAAEATEIVSDTDPDKLITISSMYPGFVICGETTLGRITLFADSKRYMVLQHVRENRYTDLSTGQSVRLKLPVMGMSRTKHYATLHRNCYLVNRCYVTTIL